MIAIAEFEKAPDLKSFPEDKVLDVIKTKMSVVKEREDELANKLAVTKKYEKLENFRFYDNWKTGITVAQLKAELPNESFFRKRINQTTENTNGLGKSDLIIHYPRDLFMAPGQIFGSHTQIMTPGSIYNILTQNGIIKGYRTHLSRFSSRDAGRSKTSEYMPEVRQYVESMIEYFGFSPSHELIENRNQYTWSNGKKAVTLYAAAYNDGNGHWVCRVVLEELVD